MSGSPDSSLSIPPGQASALGLVGHVGPVFEWTVEDGAGRPVGRAQWARNRLDVDGEVASPWMKAHIRDVIAAVPPGVGEPPALHRFFALDLPVVSGGRLRGRATHTYGFLAASVWEGALVPGWTDGSSLGLYWNRPLDLTVRIRSLIAMTRDHDVVWTRAVGGALAAAGYAGTEEALLVLRQVGERTFSLVRVHGYDVIAEDTQRDRWWRSGLGALYDAARATAWPWF